MKGGFFSQGSAAKPKAKPAPKATAAAPTPTATATPAAATDEPPATTIPDAPEEEDDPNLQSESPASLWSLPTLLLLCPHELRTESSLVILQRVEREVGGVALCVGDASAQRGQRRYDGDVLVGSDTAGRERERATAAQY
jgi:hypothetical protein